MNNIDKFPTSKVTVRFPDCDPFNHLNNARYIDYFMNAREDHLWDYYQFDLYGHTRKTGKSWVVTKNQIIYVSPASLKEQVLIQSALLNFDRNNLQVEMSMWNEKKSQLKALLWSTFTYFDLKTQRKATHDADLLDLFKQLKSEESYADSFEERLYQLREAADSIPQPAGE